MSTSLGPPRLLADTHIALLRRPVAPQVQLLRFFDCQRSYDEAQSFALLSLLAPVEPIMRQRFFVDIGMCRRRDGGTWDGTPLAPILQLRSSDNFSRVVALKHQIKAALRRLQLSADDVCRMIDTNEDQALDPREVLTFLSSPQMQQGGAMPPPSELTQLTRPLLVIAHASGGGKLSFDELRRFLA